MTYYVPDPKLFTIHDWRRPNAAQGLSPAPNTFTPDFDTPDGKAYYEGVASLAAAYFAIGALLFILYMVLNCAALCCRSRATNKPHSSVGNCCRAIFNPSAWYIVGVIVIAAVTAAAMSRMSAFKDTVTTTANGLDSLQSILGATGAFASGPLSANMSSVNASLTVLYDDAVANGAPPADLNALAGMITGAQSAGTSAAALGAQLTGAASALNSKLRAGKVNVGQLGQRVFVGGIAVLGLFFGYLLLTTVTLIRTPCCAKVFRFCAFITTIVFLLVWIFAGIFLGVSLVGSDVCVAPSSAISKTINATHGAVDGTAADTLTYYTSCASANGTVSPPTAGALLQLQLGQVQFDSTVAAFASFATGPTGQNPALAVEVAATNAALNAAGEALKQIALQASCTPVNSIYQTSIGAVCNTGIAHGIVEVWAFATAACILLFIITTSAARLVWRHPGDPPAKTGDPREEIVRGGGPAPTYIAMGPSTGAAAAYSSPATAAAAPAWR